MGLSAGTRLGPYEIQDVVGTGGMGEVYRARDVRLNRAVALKVLPEAFASDPERMARFEREAQVLASLNHSNIATIHGLEESGGIRALVMELVEGPTLADRIEQGPLPLDEALPIAKQIAEALEYAHERGIVHRDLKPANVKVTPEGKVKVLDFGLAKALDEAPAAPRDISSSPTLTIAATRAGIIQGSAGYMSPEQARGKPVDKRTDIWSFGVVLFEMLTGKLAFAGETITDVMAAVVTREPDWSVLPPGSPVRLLRRCLEKDTKRRLRDMGDAFNDDEPVALATQGEQPFWRHPLTLGLLTVAIAATGTALWLGTRNAVPGKTVSRLVIPLLPNQEVAGPPAITLDGRLIAYTTKEGAEEPKLYLRDLNSFEAKAVGGSEGAAQPFFSPEGRWVAFYAHGQLLKASVDGGSPVRIAAAASATTLGGTWNEDDTIIFVPGMGSGLMRVPASGGQPENLTKPDGAAGGYAHAWPHALPGGRRILFTIWGKESYGNAVLSLETGHWDLVTPGMGGAAWSPSGHLLVGGGNAELRAAPLDPLHPRRASAETQVLSDVDSSEDLEGPWLSVSRNGTAVYAPANPTKRSLVWVDREGKVEAVTPDQAGYAELALAPDGSKAAVKHDSDIWIYDFERGTHTRLTFRNARENSSSPEWSRDSQRVYFSFNPDGNWDIYSQPADGSRPAELVLKRPYDKFPSSTAPDGTLMFAEANPATGEDLWTVSPSGKVAPWRVTQFNDSNGVFSLDGRWVAYDSDESGRYEIYVQSYPGGEKRFIASTGGGFLPRWSGDGKELFYLTGNALMAAPVRPDGSMGTPHRLFDRTPFLLSYNAYAVSRDGKRFLMIRRDPGSVPRQLNVILNWSEELKGLK